MGTLFSGNAWTDKGVMEQLAMHMSFITGETRPEPKGKSKNDEDITPEQWFKELSWVHMFFFCQAFHEATARNCMNAVEARIAQEVFAMIDK